MDPIKCKKRSVRERTRHLTIRVTEDVSYWLKKNQYSPTAIFNEAVKELGYGKQK